MASPRYAVPDWRENYSSPGRVDEIKTLISLHVNSKNMLSALRGRRTKPIRDAASKNDNCRNQYGMRRPVSNRMLYATQEGKPDDRRTSNGTRVSGTVHHGHYRLVSSSSNQQDR